MKMKFILAVFVVILMVTACNSGKGDAEDYTEEAVIVEQVPNVEITKESTENNEALFLQ